MLKIGIGDKYYTTLYGLKKGLARLKEHGYDGIDYQGFVNTNTSLFEKTADEYERFLKEQRKVIENEGLMIHQTHGPWRYPPQDITKEDRKERFEKMTRAIEGTAVLGSRYFVIHPIMPFTKEDGGYEKETWEMNLEFMSNLCQTGRKNGVIICLENLPMQKFSMSRVPEVLGMVKTINDEYFKICLDTGHCAVCQQSPAEAVRMIGKEHLAALHVHDNDGKKDRHWQPFMGVIDWNDFGRALGEIQYEGVLSLETKRMGALPEELSKYDEIGLYNKADYIAALTSKIQENQEVLHTK